MAFHVPSPLRRLLTRILAPVHSGERETRRHILWWLLIRVLLFATLIGITSFLSIQGSKALLPPPGITILFLVLVSVYTVGSAAIFQKTAFPVRRFGLLQLGSDIVFISLLIYATGCSQSIFTPLLTLPVIAGGLILDRRGGLILAATTTLLYGAVLIAEFFGILPDYYFRSTVYWRLGNIVSNSNLFAVYGLLFFFSALISGQIARRLRSTEEKLTRTALEFDRLSLLYKQIFDDINTGIITTDQDDFITSYNRSAERITGYPQEEVLGRPFGLRFPDIALMREKQGRNVCDFRKHDGTMTRVGYSFSSLDMPLEKKAEGEASAWKVITLQDVSQIESMERQVREAEKMAAIGEMSASIAHDFRNPLAAISGSAQILAMERDSPAKTDAAAFATLLEIILRESDRMAKTITDFLYFARPAPLIPERLVLAPLVREVVRDLRSGKYEQVARKIVLRMDEGLSCQADRGQIHTALFHLLENACLAMRDGEGHILVTAWEQEDMPGELLLEVGDQGPGIAEELHEKVFMPFFSEWADGVGLGLAIVRQIVEQHRGSITISRDSSYNCIIRIRLPLAPSIP